LKGFGPLDVHNWHSPADPTSPREVRYRTETWHRTTYVRCLGLTRKPALAVLLIPGSVVEVESKQRMANPSIEDPNENCCQLSVAGSCSA
jgi:hypothetical protein